MDTKKSRLTTDRTRTEQIRADIEQTRGRMDRAIDEVEERLSPRQFMNMISDWLQGGAETGRHTMMQINQAVRDTRDAAFDIVKSHPLPVALIGTGIAWLAYERAGGPGAAELRQRGRQLYRRVAGAVSNQPESGEQEGYYGEDLGDVTERISRTTRRAMRQVRSGASTAREQASQTYQQTLDRSQEMYREHPFMFGAGALLVGLALGLALPRTEREDELMGSKAEQLKRKVGSTLARKSEELIERGREVAQATASAAANEAQRQGLGATDLREKAERIVDRVTDTAVDTARQGQPGQPGT